MKQSGKDVTMIEKIKLGAKKRAKQAWCWSKDHWAELLLGGLAIGGGAYLLTRDKGEGSEGSESQGILSQPIDYSTDEVDQKIQEAWNDCDNVNYGGPTED